MSTMENKIKASALAGFTLVELLIALFIFTILSMMMLGGLRSVISAQSGTDRSAERLGALQMALLKMSRDVEQAVNRPVINESGKVEAAFVGTSNSVAFTHAGFANPTGTLARSTLERTQYKVEDQSLMRVTWQALDQVPESEPHSRNLLKHVTAIRFQYLDNKNRFEDKWPVDAQAEQPLPRAIRVNLTIANWGEMSQLYVIPAQIKKPTQATAKP